MKEYVLGFMFSPDKQQVLLITKDRPAWQYGRVNGIGGKKEPIESHYVAMTREFKEETGIDTHPNDWELGVSLVHTERFIIWIFRAFGDVHSFKKMESEQPFVADVDDLPPNVIGNLRWIIPLLLDDELVRPITVLERDEVAVGTE